MCGTPHPLPGMLKPEALTEDAVDSIDFITARIWGGGCSAGVTGGAGVTVPPSAGCGTLGGVVPCSELPGLLVLLVLLVLLPSPSPPVAVVLVEDDEAFPMVQLHEHGMIQWCCVRWNLHQRESRVCDSDCSSAAQPCVL